MASLHPATADLWDAHHERLQMLSGAWRSFGGHRRFAGPIETLCTREGHAAIRAVLNEPGNGRVLVIANGVPSDFAMVGGMMARIAADHGWSGIVVDGVVRDTAEIAEVAVGVMARGTTAKRSFRTDVSSQQGQPVAVGGVVIVPGTWLYADEDAIVIAPERLDLPVTSTHD